MFNTIEMTCLLYTNSEKVFQMFFARQHVKKVTESFELGVAKVPEVLEEAAKRIPII